LAERRLHGTCLESAMTLAEHDLLTLRVLQINEFFLFEPVGNLETDYILPKGKADIQVGDMELRHDIGPTRTYS
jgi:hypothetical protein